MSDLLVATQQSSGRVAYSRFDRSLRAWAAIDKQVIASASIGIGIEDSTVSIVRRADSSSPLSEAIGIFYETDNEDVAGTLYRRCAYRETTDDGDTWSAEEQIGHWGVATNDTPARAIADNAGRILFHFGNQDTPGFGNIFCQTRAADGSLSIITTVFTGGGLSQIQMGRCVGDPCGFDTP